jgi:hypothetical protein
MGEKAKGRDSKKVKKPKAPKVGNRPHEERQRQAALTQAAPEPVKGQPAVRG